MPFKFFRRQCRHLWWRINDGKAIDSCWGRMWAITTGLKFGRRAHMSGGQSVAGWISVGNGRPVGIDVSMNVVLRGMQTVRLLGGLDRKADLKRLRHQ